MRIEQSQNTLLQRSHLPREQSEYALYADITGFSLTLNHQTAIGKVDEILGPINQVFITVKPQEGIQATSFKSGDKFYIGGDKLLPLEKFVFVRVLDRFFTK